MNDRLLTLVAGLTLTLAVPGVAAAQADKVRAELVAVGALKPPGIIAATVAEEPIDISEVNRLVKIALRGRVASKAALPGLEAQALEQVINRRLVLLFLDAAKITVTKAEVEKTIIERDKTLRKADSNLAEVLAQSGMTLDAYEGEIEWELRWAKYLKKKLTDEELQKYFDAHRQEYDGTELRVSHIMLRPDGPLDPEEVDSLIRRADTIRDQIIGGLTTFEDAAKKFSSGPSRQSGGDIGFIPRHGLMPEDFSDAAFTLKPGELSKPIITHLGVHLILCTEVQPGKKQLGEVRKEVQPAAQQAMFLYIAKQMREKTAIEYTGAVAHLNLETGDLIKPAGEASEAPAEGAEK